MTGEKNRYSSIEKLWKFNDETLKTKEHDEMVLYLLNTKNIRKVLPVINVAMNNIRVRVRSRAGKIFFDALENFWEKIKHQHSLTFEDYRRIAEEIRKTDYEKFYKIIGEVNLTKAELEKWRNGESIEKINNRVLDNDFFFTERWGNSVLIKEIQRTVIDHEWKKLIKEYEGGGELSLSKVEKQDITILSEVPILTDNKFIVGYWDIVITFPNFIFETEHFTFYRRECPTIYIEVKPKISSFGATLRQLKTYQKYQRGAIGRTYLFTKDLRFKEAFENQGIRVITYPGNGSPNLRESKANQVE